MENGAQSTNRSNGPAPVIPLPEQMSHDAHFLVTHWLTNYSIKSSDEEAKNSNRDDHENSQKNEVVNRIKGLAGELANAFAELGAFGKFLENPLETPSSGSANNKALRRASYIDVANKWAYLPTNQLESVLQSSHSATHASWSATEQINSPLHLLDAAYEKNAINIDNSDSVAGQVTSILQPSSLLHATSNDNISNKTNEQQSSSYPSLNLSLGSSHSKILISAANASRNELSTRQKFFDKQKLLATVQRSLSSQKIKQSRLKEQIFSHLQNPNNQLNLEQHQHKTMECERVISQLSRDFIDIQDALRNLELEHKNSSSKAQSLRKQASNLTSNHWDPTLIKARCNITSTKLAPYSSSYYVKGNQRNPRPTMLQDIMSRQYCGGGGGLLKRKHTFIGKRPLNSLPLQSIHKSILQGRVSHCVTINSHLLYPIYCLCFDKSGKYFVTGADDHLVKLFLLGGATPSSSSFLRRKSTYDIHPRGAVLVTTLRGHAGVVTDIDISSDNALLATASEDGTCRVWGLHDGSPIAVLRGHVGGANMVSWSTLTPYRLLTSSMDGLARMWDIREAALKRYRYIVGQRYDYKLPDPSSNNTLPRPNIVEGNSISEEEEDVVVFENEGVPRPPSLPAQIALPPIPQRLETDLTNNNNTNNISLRNNPFQMNIVVPPLPIGANPLGQGNELTSAQAVIAANTEERCDEGVRLLSKLQHGEPNLFPPGPGTRNRRKPVKVICLARCPVGGHFTTGSDDGIGRVWEDSEDSRLVEIDLQYNERKYSGRQLNSKSTCLETFTNPRNITASTSTLLASLTGHINSITDIAYSHSGDRILTASQKDGVLRIWAWGKESRLNFKEKRGARQQIGGNTHLTQILIRLTGGASSQNDRQSSGRQTRRRGGSRSNANLNSGSSNVHCDVAVWSSDDKTVITSQTIPAKVNTNDIVPGSNIIHVWDSHSGTCLLGIFGAHDSPCPLLAVHPNDSSILASGGADGQLHLWDLDTGKSFFNYKNTLKYGTCDRALMGKNCGFLDGSFSPDGLTLVLTDDTGSITILDTLSSKSTKSNTPQHRSQSDSLLRLRQDGLMLTGEAAVREDNVDSNSDELVRLHPWMTEQYFANDYYDIDYDAHGYAVERGSGAPPHLAPRASRCNHTGTAVSTQINIGFLKIKGPLPLPEHQCRWKRKHVQSNLKFLKSKNCEVLERNISGKKAIAIAQIGTSTHRVYHNAACERSYDIIQQNQQHHNTNTQNSERQPTRRTNDSRPSTVRYRDDDDILDIEEVDDNDEDFVLPAAGNRFLESSSEDEFDEHESEEEGTPTSRRRSNARQNRSNQRATNTPRNTSTEERSNRRRQRSRIEEVSEEAVARTPVEASRTSSRSAVRNRRTYEESDGDSDSDDLHLMNGMKLSKDNPFRKDYTTLGHFYCLPFGDEPVEKEWLIREESATGYQGLKTYAPQVGDKVVYIPRAHYDTLARFPGTSDTTPWKQFPQNREWSIVQCVIKNVRYRFPYENYYRKASGKGDNCRSIVAIVTLEVTGIPRTGHRSLPWIDPNLVSIETMRTRSNRLEEFEVSMFQNNEIEFLIPECLFRMRLNNLERAIHENNGDPFGIELSINYTDMETDDMDGLMQVANCKIVTVSDHDNPTEPHFQQSGYESIEVNWDDNAEIERFSSWEVNVPKYKNSDYKWPSLSEEEKKHFHLVLDKLDERGPFGCFSEKVDYSRYATYLEWIEVPMYLSLIRKRVDNYYSNKLSIFADIKLITENCVKYNDSKSRIVEAALMLQARFLEIIHELESGQAGKEDVHHDTTIASTSRKATGPTVSIETQSSSILSSPSTLEALPKPKSTKISDNSTDSNKDKELFSDSKVARRSQRNVSLTSSHESATCALQNPIHQSNSNTFANHNTPDSITSRLRSRTRSTKEDCDDEQPKNIKSSEDLEEPSSNKRHRTTIANSRIAVKSDSDYSVSPPSKKKLQVSQFESDNFSESVSNYDMDSEGNSDYSEQSSIKVQKRSSRIIRKRNIVLNESYGTSDISDEDSEMNLSTDSLKSPFRKANRKKSNRRSPQNGHTSQEIEDDFEEEEENTPRRASLRARRKTEKAQYSENGYSSDEFIPEATSKRKARRTPKKNKKKVKIISSEDELFYPDVQKWPSINDKKLMRIVAFSVMDKVEKLDKDELFSQPVVEMYPDLASKYLRVVKEPMDFRTIMEMRIHDYEDISELQDDLILVFKNCCLFNGERNEYWVYAVDLWKQLKNLFKEACKEEGHLVPRRF